MMTIAMEYIENRTMLHLEPMRLDSLSTGAYLGDQHWLSTPFSGTTPWVLQFRQRFVEAFLLRTGAKQVCMRTTKGYFGFSFGGGYYPDALPLAARASFMVHVHDWTHSPPFEIRSPITYKHERPFHPLRGSMTNAQARAAGLGRTFAIQPFNKRLAAYDMVARDLPCLAIADVPQDSLGRLLPQAMAMPFVLARRNKWLREPRVPFRFYGSSDVANNGDGSMSVEEQRRTLRNCEQRLRIRAGEATKFYDITMSTLHDAPVCVACGA